MTLTLELGEHLTNLLAGGMILVGFLRAGAWLLEVLR